MKVLITAGGMSEYIDDVRVLTNVSTGKLGAKVAETFYESKNKDIHITYLAPRTAVMPEFSFNPNKSIKCITVKTAQDLHDKMQELVPEMDIVVHSAAVSDFSFKPCTKKLKSNDPEGFIESMRERIVKNVKILPLVKQWNSECLLFSFKFEVGESIDSLIRIAAKSGKGAGSNYVIANDKKQMQAVGEHVAYVIEPDGDYKKEVFGKQEISETIVELSKDYFYAY